MIRQFEDAVCTYVKTTITPVIPNRFVMEQYWGEVARQVQALIGVEKAITLASVIDRDPVKFALYRKSEQSRIDLILWLQRTGKL